MYPATPAARNRFILEAARMAVAMVEEAEASLARGEGLEITEKSMQTLSEDVKRRTRRRIVAEDSATSR